VSLPLLSPPALAPALNFPAGANSSGPGPAERGRAVPGVLGQPLDVLGKFQVVSSRWGASCRGRGIRAGVYRTGEVAGESNAVGSWGFSTHPAGRGWVEGWGC